MSATTSYHRFAVAAFAIVATIAAAPASAVQSPPNIRGMYFVNGTTVTYACEFGGPGSSGPDRIYFVVTSQDGAAFVAFLGSPDGAYDFVDLSGQVAADGSVSGTWMYGSGVTNPGIINDQAFTGKVVGQKVALDLTAVIGSPGATCQYLISLSSGGVVLSWVMPDPDSSDPLSPPRWLVAEKIPPLKTSDVVFSQLGDEPSFAAAPRDNPVTSYRVYRSTMPGVQPTPANFFASVPPTVTTLQAPDGFDGSFFVVTATYANGESGPSNEATGGIPAANLSSVKVAATKIVAKGRDFSHTVLVFVDGIPFAAPAKVKGTTKVTQKGNLITGQSLSQYVTSGRRVLITFRNESGGIASFFYTKP